MNTVKLKSVIKSVAFGILVATIVITGLFIVASVLLLYSNLPMKFVSPIATVVSGLGSFLAAYIISKLLGCKGLLVGLIFGLVVSALIFTVTLVTAGVLFSFSELTRIIIVMITSCLGGVLGVNSAK